MVWHFARVVGTVHSGFGHKSVPLTMTTMSPPPIPPVPNACLDSVCLSRYIHICHFIWVNPIAYSRLPRLPRACPYKSSLHCSRDTRNVYYFSCDIHFPRTMYDPSSSTSYCFSRLVTAFTLFSSDALKWPNTEPICL